METAERRLEILRALCKSRHDTVENLAFKFGVSERTIRRDIEILSCNYPVYTQSGRYNGGVYVMEGYTMDNMYMTETELNVLKKLLSISKRKSIITLNEQNILNSIISQYTKPILKGKKFI